jgi:hypothetical protein
MASPSEQISLKWIEGAERKCVRCGVAITNMVEQIGEVRSRYVKGRSDREIICKDCKLAGVQALIDKTRKELGLPQLS